MKACPNANGYLRVNLRPGPRAKMVHRLVLEAFVGPCPGGMQCCHNDGVRTNNRLDNLRWDTPLANAADTFRHGTARVGVGHHRPTAKVGPKVVRRIRAAYAGGKVTYRALAVRYGLSQAGISLIVRRKSWPHVS